jgi:hypothetical protein
MRRRSGLSDEELLKRIQQIELLFDLHNSAMNGKAALVIFARLETIKRSLEGRVAALASAREQLGRKR